TNGSSITYNIDGLSKGGYNFTLVVFDASNNYNTHTVLVTVSDETNPGIDTPQSDLTDYVEGSGGNSLSWAVSDIYPTTYEIYQNLTVIIGSGSWNNGVNITVSIDGLTKGIYNFTLYVYDESGNIGSHVVWVTVIDDVDPIFVETPVDIPDYIEEVTLTSLSWNTTDLYEGTYIIYQNLTIPVGSGSWTNSSEITQPINGLSIGVYNFTIFVSDASGNTINDTVWVTVSDTTPPSIDDEPSNLVYIEGNTGNMIRWNVSDTNPAMYIVNNNSILYDSGTYNGGTVWISVDGLPIGIYTFELILNDTSGNITPHSVTVTVIETTSPTFDKIPVYREYYESDPTSYTLGWNVTDTYPGTYLVYTWDGFTNTTIDSSSWTNADNITINISGLSKGLYNYSILVYDSSFNLVSHWVYVNVTDATAPVIAAYPSDFAYESGSTGNVLSWNATDNYADKYEIYKNGTLEIFGTGSWNTPTLIEYNIDGLDLFVYNYTIIFYDLSGNFALNTVLVTVDDLTPPQFVAQPGPVSFNETRFQYLVFYIVIDNNPNNFLTYIDGQDTGFTGSWSNNSIFPLDLVQFNRPKGVYNFTIVFFDDNGNANSSTIFFTVTDETHPVFTQVPSDILDYVEGNTGYSLTWTMGDNYPDTLELYQNATLFQGPDNWAHLLAESINID
ncbi:MAG: PKD domain-containing protein, partial [Candidatus Kariarchaeaceae archaeon]